MSPHLSRTLDTPLRLQCLDTHAFARHSHHHFSVTPQLAPLLSN